MPQPIDIARQIWERSSPDHPVAQYEKDKFVLELTHRLIHFFQAGDFYVYLFNIAIAEFEFISPGIEKVLGYRPEEISLDFLFDKIHPEDQKFYVNFENEASKFLLGLPREKLFKYKLRVDFRMRKRDGTYTRILHQAMIFETGLDGMLQRTLGVHTDIGHLKTEGNPTLSFIGLDDEPSYVNVQPGVELIPIKDQLSKREKEILLLIMEGLQNKAIAEKLHLSKETVDKHRKNMLAKTDSKSSAELITKAIRNGWV